MIQLSHGSIFDKKCDLLIIPCNDRGGITPWVTSNLRENDLPLPYSNTPFGKVTFMETGNKLENAEVVGFAASVKYHPESSSKAGIIRIGKEIHKYCKEHLLRQVNIPLLGTGAGKLSPFDSFEALVKSLGDNKEPEPYFEVFTPSLDIYKSLRASYSELLERPKEIKLSNPRVFISYAGDDDENKKWVKKLATKLRENGVDARVDFFHLKPGTDLPQWMTNELIKSDKVLLVCDLFYVKKADVRKGGVGWETMIIQGDMLIQGDNKSKYIAIVREDKIDTGLPIYMKSKSALHWKNEDDIPEEDFQQLLYSIFDCDVAPELGEIPKFVLNKLSNAK